MLDCKDLTRLIASDELASAGWAKRVQARVHLMMCRDCRAFADQIRAIGEGARRLFRARPETERATLERLRDSILKRD